ncbi:M28 family metallopeptidase [Sphingomonas sp. HITSZ_GF]|uniref:M28 family metallopeptidase n=1 Tax=Sphingomonas sp. HITSZ_GF TaxID=3037247 RepID=UPI00240CEE5F|nr:M28 family metallopeptidase [Sphingomonas sp. HITSZ_GF]MDG2535611.1 M28 family metallopeptidase [Sphingomonas sp. HITSZ_GF]
MRHLLTVALLLAGTAANAQTIPIETAKEVTQVLSSDAYEGRGPTTPAEDKTIAYIVQRFEKAGLKPGNKGKWTQDVPLVEITANHVAPLVFTGGKAPVSLDYRSDMVIATYRVVPKVAIKDSDVVFVGYGINAPERGWNDYAGLDVKGKTVVILVNDPDYKAPEAKGLFDGRAMTYYGRWTYKFEEAARQGAAAAIIVHDAYPASYPWGVVQSSWTGAQLEQDTPGDHMDQSQAIGWMQLDKAKALFAAAGQDFDALSVAAAQKGFKAVPLGVKASVSWENTIRRQASKNVVGILPGTAKPDEVVLYSAHWDHLGRCDAVNGDDICNGAVDNASGMGGLVALAEAHAKAGPAKRSLVFLAVTAEESGLLGSKFYAENPVYPLAKTVGGVNMDTLNVIGKAKDFVIAGAGKSELEDLVKPFVAAEGRVIVPEARPEAGGYYRSDHFSFAKLGVPMLYGESGDDLVVGGKEAGEKAAKDYTQSRYHKPQDEYNPAWDWSGAASDLAIYYGLGRQLAEGAAWPNWYPSAEFRAIRDKSRAGQ